MGVVGVVVEHAPLHVLAGFGVWIVFVQPLLHPRHIPQQERDNNDDGRNEQAHGRINLRY